MLQTVVNVLQVEETDGSPITEVEQSTTEDRDIRKRSTFKKKQSISFLSICYSDHIFTALTCFYISFYVLLLRVDSSVNRIDTITGSVSLFHLVPIYISSKSRTVCKQDSSSLKVTLCCATWLQMHMAEQKGSGKLVIVLSHFTAACENVHELQCMWEGCLDLVALKLDIDAVLSP